MLLQNSIYFMIFLKIQILDRMQGLSSDVQSWSDLILRLNIIKLESLVSSPIMGGCVLNIDVSET